MVPNNYISFCEQLYHAKNKYPNLKIHQDNNGISYLQGILDIPNDHNEIVGQFLVEIRCPENFPYQFPILYETGNDIPNLADWHKYKDDRCCITVWQDEAIKCKNGITVNSFIEKYAISYFANYIFRKQTGKYKNGEFAHGLPGILQFYVNLLKTTDKKLWMRYFKYAFGGVKVSCGMDDLCFCGSNELYKNCHMDTINSLRLMGENMVFRDFLTI